MIARAVRTLALSLTLLATMIAFAQSSDVVTEDFYVAHSSTVPVNRGATVRLFTRHYHTENSGQGALIVLSSDILAADAGLGLDFGDDSHLEYFASLGFDVFAADVTGYGLSPKPQMGDGCNAASSVQPMLMPYPLYIPCEPTYTRVLTSLSSDWDEIDSIVEHVRGLTGDDRVSLMGWSLGAARAAGYAAQNPEAVEQLVLIAPLYDPDAPADVPAPYPDGQPLRVHAVDALIDEWRRTVQCEGQANFDGVGEQLRQKVNELDPVAADWGYDLGNLFRSPGVVGLAGFDSETVTRIDAPTLVVVGLDDSNAAHGDALYEDLTVEEKLRMDVECGTHWLIWEDGFGGAREAIGEFLQSGTVDGQERGELTIDREVQ